MQTTEKCRFQRKIGFYEKYIKRLIDIVCAVLAILVFGWLYIIVAILVKIKLGRPIIFEQYRSGLIDPNTGKERIFKMYKFRTMVDKRDENGVMLSDEERITKFGSWLRSTSLDELPEAFCILNGTMSIVGPRPQLVKDMVFMSDEQRMRHTARPGLSGLAQVKGRNAITWDEKLAYDLEYIKKVTFINDLKIVIMTFFKAFVKQEGITEEGKATAADYGDYLLGMGKIGFEEYKKKMLLAQEILKDID